MKNADKVLPKVLPDPIHHLPITDLDLDWKDTPDVVMEKLNAFFRRKDIKFKFVEVDGGGDYHSFMMETTK